MDPGRFSEGLRPGNGTAGGPLPPCRSPGSPDSRQRLGVWGAAGCVEEADLKPAPIRQAQGRLYEG